MEAEKQKGDEAYLKVGEIITDDATQVLYSYIVSHDREIIMRYDHLMNCRKMFAVYVLFV